jgi:hypothetical protein
MKLSTEHIIKIYASILVAGAILLGFYLGAKIISTGLVEANRFQFISNEHFSAVFDSLSGAAYRLGDDGWIAVPKSYPYMNSRMGYNDRLIQPKIDNPIKWYIFKTNEFWKK